MKMAKNQNQLRVNVLPIFLFQNSPTDFLDFKVQKKESSIVFIRSIRFREFIQTQGRRQHAY